LVANLAAHFFVFYLLGATYAPMTAHDFQLRAVTTGFMNSFDMAFISWWPIIFYSVIDAPHYQKGYVASLVTGAAVLPLIFVIAYLERRGLARGTLGRQFGEEDAHDGDSSVVDVVLKQKS
jgi:ACS family pantothenate transporter-like MFS transporter